MSTRDPNALLEKLRELPPDSVAEVEKFIDLLRVRARRGRDSASARLGEAMARLDALGLPPMTEDEVQAEIDAARRERRERFGADRR